MGRVTFSELIRCLIIGILGFMSGYLYYYMAFFNYTDPFMAGLYRETSGGTIFGAITIGLAFGAFNRNIVKGIKLSVAGLLGFLIGDILELVIVRIFPLFIVVFPLLSFFSGLIGGAFFGLVLWDIKKVFKIAIAGGLGVFIGNIFGVIFLHNILISFMGYGTIAGAFLGVGMYFAEKDDMVKML